MEEVVRENDTKAAPSSVAPTFYQVVEVAMSLTRKDGDKVNEQQITDCVLQKFPNWCSKGEAAKFVQEFMLKAESQGLCKKSGSIAIWSMKTLVPPSDVSVTVRDTSGKKDAPEAPPKVIITETRTITEKAPANAPVEPKAPVDAFTPYECKHCQEKQANGTNLVSQHGFTSREITMMISQLLRRDEAEFGGMHCFCDKCLDITTDGKRECRITKVENAVKSEKVEKNMELLRLYQKWLLEHKEKKGKSGKRKRGKKGQEKESSDAKEAAADGEAKE